MLISGNNIIILNEAQDFCAICRIIYRNLLTNQD